MRSRHPRPLTASRLPSASAAANAARALSRRSSARSASASPHKRLRETGAQQTGAAKRGQRLLVPAELQQGGAEIERGLGKIRAPLQRLARGPRALVQAPQPTQRAGAAAMQVRVERAQAQRGVERGKRFLVSAEPVDELAQIGPGGRLARLAFERALVEPDGGLGLAAALEDIAAHAEGLGEIGLQPQRLVKAVGGVLRAPGVPQRERLGIERDGTIDGRRRPGRVVLHHACIR